MTLAYDVRLSPTRAHTFEVLLTIAQPQADQALALPAWIPGSYLIREFTRHLGPLSASQGRRACTIRQEEKALWRVQCKAAGPLQVRYTVYAHDASVRTARLEASRGFFNPTSVCLQVLGHTEQAHVLHLHAPQHAKDWRVATGARTLKVNKAGWGTYQFKDYDELADSPFEMGPLWMGSFDVAGVPHQFAVTHTSPTFDGERLLRDTQAIVSTQIRFWHGRKKPPHDRYAFLLATQDDGYGGLEHQHSTALICKRADLPRLGDTTSSEGYQDLLGLISHEYFHTWNVKRMRPAELARYDYCQENYTELLWFFEGFTSYYDDLFLRRTGLIDDVAYLRLLVKNIQALASNPGAQVQSVAQASFDAWTKYYRPDENTINATVSYYSKGALVALCLDLTLRREGRGTLDAVMRHLWQAQAGQVKAIAEADIATALEVVGGRCFAPELQAWVHGREPLPVQELLADHGVWGQTQALTWAQKLGVKVQDGDSSQQRSLKIQSVLRGSCAEAAGLAAGDEWLGVEAAGQIWRLYQLEQLAYLLPPEVQAGHAPYALLYSREQNIHRSQMSLMPWMPAQGALHALQVQDPLKAQAWLGPQA